MDKGTRVVMAHDPRGAVGTVQEVITRYEGCCTVALVAWDDGESYLVVVDDLRRARR